MKTDEEILVEVEAMENKLKADIEENEHFEWIRDQQEFAEIESEIVENEIEVKELEQIEKAIDARLNTVDARYYRALNAAYARLQVEIESIEAKHNEYLKGIGETK